MVDLLIPDTNVLLDVLRARAVSQGQNPAPGTSAEDATHISRLVASSDVRVGIPHLVAIEYERNVEMVIRTALHGYQEIANRLARLGIPELPSNAIKAEQLLANDKLAAEQLMAQAETLEEHEEDLRRADDRYRQRRPPAHLGKSTTHDSRVLETALRVARTREHTTTWLLTRNTTEFEQDGELLPELRDEYEEAGLSHARSWRGYLALKQAQHA